MRLSKLTLQGYKTFATKTDFLFDGNITAIVGPNGSGKSNIADAIRWVLGEQSYMTLRGKRTTDMIFAGGRNRSRAGMAQAILTLDNTNGWLPIDFSEIEIGRRAYRSGENEYILNGQRVRLKDVSELLANSGLAERTYTIIGQGLVDQALSLRPQERRALFEEAAGIGLYKSKRAETVRRLEETKINFDRVHDILAELTPRLRQLKRQANRTRNYDQVASDLNHLLKIWYGYQWALEQDELLIHRKLSSEAEANWQVGRDTSIELRKEIEEHRQRLQNSREKITEIEFQRETIRDSLGLARQEAAVAAERKSSIELQKSSLAMRIELLETGLTEAKEKLKQSKTEVEAASAEQNSAILALDEFQNKRGVDEDAIEKMELSIGSMGDETRKMETQLARAEAQAALIGVRLLEVKKAIEGSEDIGTLQVQADRSLSDLEQTKNALDINKSDQTALLKSRENSQAQLIEEDEEYRELISKIALFQDSISRGEAKLEILSRQLEKAGDLPESVKISGRLLDSISVSVKYRKALGAALAGAIDAYVVETETDLWQLIDLRKQEEKNVSVIFPDQTPIHSKQIKHPGIGIKLSELIEVDDRLGAAVGNLLDNFYMIDDEKQGLEIIDQLPSAIVLVTLEGLIIRRGMLIQNYSSSSQDNEYETQNLIAELQSQTASQRSQIEILEKKAVAVQGKKDTLANIIEELDQKLLIAREDENHIESEAARLRALYDQEHRQIGRLAREADVNKGTRAELDDQQKALQQEIQDLTDGKASINDNIQNAKNKLSTLPVMETKQERYLLEQQLQSANTIAAGRLAVVDSRKTTLDQVQEQYNRAQNDLQELEAQQKDLDVDAHEFALAALENDFAAANARLRPSKEALSEQQKQLEEMERKLDRQQIRNDALEGAYTQAKINSSQQENNVQGLKERIQTELGIVKLPAEDDTGQTPLPMSDIVEELPVVDELPEDIERSIQRLRGQLNRMGAINPDAPEEYLELEDRFEFLQEQVADLEETSVRLRAIISELDELTSKSFAETVERVDLEFRHVFTRLFGGGTAQLVLTDPEEVAFSGVDIVARLPGRRAQNLGLLSGGERALTAAALVFSLLKVSPTPFCVLDEVDAMLDEANITRFRDMLYELSQQTQFVVITHNRGTIQVADNVYGVSMGADSSSQVISIKPEAYIAASSSR